MIAAPSPPLAHRRHPYPVVVGTALATVAILAGGGVRQVDDTFTRRDRWCDLRRPETCIADLAAVAPSPIGLLQWNPGSTLQADVGTVALATSSRSSWSPRAIGNAFRCSSTRPRSPPSRSTTAGSSTR